MSKNNLPTIAITVEVFNKLESLRVLLKHKYLYQTIDELIREYKGEKW